MAEIFEWFSQNCNNVGGSIVGTAIRWLLGLGAVIMVIIEFLPIVKMHPISSVLKWIGERVNKEVMQEVNCLKTTIKDIQEENAERYAITCRTRILRFGDEIRQGSSHSKESYDQVFEDIDYYDKYCYEHPDFKNNKTRLTTKKILETYSQSMDTDNFL